MEVFILIPYVIYLIIDKQLKELAELILLHKSLKRNKIIEKYNKTTSTRTAASVYYTCSIEDHGFA